MGPGFSSNTSFLHGGEMTEMYIELTGEINIIITAFISKPPVPDRRLTKTL
jgi:hypothetical protein